MEVEVIRRRLQVRVEQEEILRSQRALEHSVHLPAMAEVAGTQMLAEAQRYVLIPIRLPLLPSCLIRWTVSDLSSSSLPTLDVINLSDYFRPTFWGVI